MSRRKVGHIGNGTVYLLSDAENEYVNVDLPQSGSALALDCPAGVRKWGTIESDYFARLSHINEFLLGKAPPDHETTVTDRYGSFQDMPFDDEELDEIICRQVFEHLSKTESKHAMAECRRALKPGGILRIDVPDHEEALAVFARTKASAEALDDEGRIEEALKLHNHAAFMLRHLLGSRKNDWAYHLGSWTKERLIRFCASYGFNFWNEETNIHFYPAFCLRFGKAEKCDFPELDEQIIPWKAAYEYCGDPLGTPLSVPAGWKVLEIGPGRNPWPRSNALVDIDEPNLDRIKDQFRKMPGVEWPEMVSASVENLPDAWTGKFDFAFLSHIMEHVPNPLKAAAEINRVAKAGCIVCPSPWKEGLFVFHEQDHRWTVQKWRDELHFYKIPDGLYPALYSAELSGESHRIWRYGERRIETICNQAKKWFHEKEPALDVVHHWRGELKVRVFE